jgi:phosphoserine phosphatase
MGGNVLFQDALAARLELITPSKLDVDNFLKKNSLHLSDGVKDLIAAMHLKGIKVFLVSGGFRQVSSYVN